MKNFFKIVIAVGIFIILTFVELALLISDYGRGENQWTRLVAMLSLAGIGFGLFSMLFWEKRSLLVGIFILISSIIFIFASFFSEKFSDLFGFRKTYYPTPDQYPTVSKDQIKVFCQNW